MGIVPIKANLLGESGLVSQTRLPAMVSLSQISENNGYLADECKEMTSSSSIVLQSSMAKGWGKVLRRRAVAHLGAARSSRSRAFRLKRMLERRDLVLSGKAVEPRTSEVSVLPAFSGLDLPQDSGEDSEDEPLIRKVVSKGFKSSTFDVPLSGPSSESGFSSNSEESECESASEEDSESESDEEDEVEYLGRETVLSHNLSQELLSRWLLPMVKAVEVF